MFKNFEKIWRERKVDWNKSYFVLNHPHRILICRELLRFKFKSVFEIGCGAGANLFNIHAIFKGAEVGGTDINPEAVATALRNLPFAKDLNVGTADNIFFSDKSIDILLTDACLLYIGPFKIKKVLREMARVARNGIILCELWRPKWWQRFMIWWYEGYWLHNWPKILPKYGFYDVKITKITKEQWPDSLWYVCGYLISARI